MKPSHTLDTINLEFDEEIMDREKTTEAQRNAGTDPRTMKMKQKYQGHDRVCEQMLSNGTDRASCPAREPIDDDDGRLAMRIRPSSTGLPTELGKDAPCHLRRRLHKSMI